MDLWFNGACFAGGEEVRHKIRGLSNVERPVALPKKIVELGDIQFGAMPVIW